MITTHRGHFIGKGVLILFDAFFFAIIGSSVEIFVGFQLFRQIWALWLHSEVQPPLGWVGRFILMTPQAHKVHHSKNEKHFDKNFGTLFVFWDRIFGTYHTPEPVTSIGVEDDPYNQKGFIVDMFIGIRQFLRKLLFLDRNQTEQK